MQVQAMEEVHSVYASSKRYPGRRRVVIKEEGKSLR